MGPKRTSCIISLTDEASAEETITEEASTEDAITEEASRLARLRVNLFLTNIRMMDGNSECKGKVKAGRYGSKVGFKAELRRETAGGGRGRRETQLTTVIPLPFGRIFLTEGGTAW